MAEYIDREELLELYCTGNTVIDEVGVVPLQVIRQNIMDMPAQDVAPVRHGRWEFLGPNRLIGDCMCGTCSVCKVRCKYIVNKNICPNCGAKMYGDRKEGADNG